MKPHRSPKARKVVVHYRDIPHCLDLVVCRKALVRCQVDGKFHSMQQLADAAGCSRSTVSRFFAGRNNSLTTTLSILDRLGLRFDDMATPVGSVADCREVG